MISNSTTVDADLSNVLHARLLVVLATMFPALEADDIGEIADKMQPVHLRRDDVLFRQGDPGDSLYILVTGRLQVIGRSAAGLAKVLNELTSGDSVGEMALITGELRTADVTALRDSHLACLSRDAFVGIAQRYPQVLMVIARNVIRWLRCKEQPVGKAIRCRTIAVMGSQDELPLAEITGRLADIGPCIHLRSGQIEGLTGLAGRADWPDADVRWARLAAWLDHQESTHEFVLFQTDPEATPWTRFCIRQADVVLVLALWTQNPIPGPLEVELLTPGAGPKTSRRCLVLLHADGVSLPAGTNRFLACRSVDAHCHVRMDRQSDISRLARMVTGRAVGLALGGGGARGLAHIGVLAALTEAGVPIDVVGGTSMGAIIGALHAMGLGRPAMIEVNNRMWRDIRPFNSYTVPIVSLFGHRKFDQCARLASGDAHIEDLWLDYFCISSNLTTFEMMVHRQGPLGLAVRASASLPGAVAPILCDGQLLVDGGLLNNLPGDVMAQFNCARVIVVNVSPVGRLTTTCREMPSVWRQLGSRLGFRIERPDVPNILDILDSSIMVTSNARSMAVSQDADYSLQLPVSGFKMLQFDAIDQLVRLGYEYTRERIGEIKAAIGQGSQL